MTIAPRRPAARQLLREGAVEEERCLEVDVHLSVPVGLVDLADVVTAAQDRRKVSQRDERADRIFGRLDELRVAVDIGDVGPEPDVPVAGERGREVAGARLRQVDRSDARAAIGEGPGDGRADPAYGTGDDDTPTVEPLAEAR